MYIDDWHTVHESRSVIYEILKTVLYLNILYFSVFKDLYIACKWYNNAI
jgi:hypothetical protein